MYLPAESLQQVLKRIQGHFERIVVLMDCYSSFAAKASKVKNPVQDVGVSQVYGLDDPLCLEGEGIRFAGEREMTPEDRIKELKGFEQKIFRKLYAGSFSKKLYRLYEFEGNGLKI